MHDLAHFALISVAVFSGAVVSGFAGFAFSAVAGAILLHVMPPMEAVPLMMACSVLVQLASLCALMRGVQWRRSLILAAGGLLGIAPAVYLLQHVDTWLFRIGFGVFVAVYSAYMLLRSAVTRRPCSGGVIGEGAGRLRRRPDRRPHRDARCAAHHLVRSARCAQRRAARRGFSRFILIMQLVALALLLAARRMVVRDHVRSCRQHPGACGRRGGQASRCFGRVDESLFRRVVLTTLLVSGMALMV